MLRAVLIVLAVLWSLAAAQASEPCTGAARPIAARFADHTPASPQGQDLPDDRQQPCISVSGQGKSETPAKPFCKISIKTEDGASDIRFVYGDYPCVVPPIFQMISNSPRAPPASPIVSSLC